MKIIQPKIKKEFEYEPEEHYTLLQSSYDLYFNKAHIEFDEDTTQMDTLYFNQCTFESIDFTKIHGLDLVFHGCDLSNCQFEDASLNRIQFKDGRMIGATFTDLTLKHVQFSNCQLKMSQFVNCQFDHVLFNDNQMSETYISFCKQKALEIKDCSLTSLEVVETSLNGVDLSSNEIEELVIQPTDLKGATVSEYQAYDILPLFGVKVT
ncbi:MULTISPECIES: pentapeptide repeat-containing protein [unclassified Mammaliicoccus]|uniref:pentapeptide repeat-containing protein n=1 Tax=Mammaliicoccus TaxID=2803850 RepID=UPI001EFB419D|nr:MULTISPECIES: pentapeptide repeat-containing protein [unclassified Mammaliicoccus]